MLEYLLTSTTVHGRTAARTKFPGDVAKSGTHKPLVFKFIVAPVQPVHVELGHPVRIVAVFWTASQLT